MARTLHPDSLFDTLARQDGIHLPDKGEEDLADLTVEAAMRPRRVVLDAKARTKVQVYYMIRAVNTSGVESSSARVVAVRPAPVKAAKVVKAKAAK